jgi:hypothetical protein
MRGLIMGAVGESSNSRPALTSPKQFFKLNIEKVRLPLSTARLFEIIAALVIAAGLMWALSARTKCYYDTGISMKCTR